MCWHSVALEKWRREGLKNYRPQRAPFSEKDGTNTAKLCSGLSKLSGRVLVLVGGYIWCGGLGIL
jgi:hypothetical protein